MDLTLVQAVEDLEDLEGLDLLEDPLVEVEILEMNYRLLDMMTCLCKVIFMLIFFKTDKKFYKFSVPTKQI